MKLPSTLAFCGYAASRFAGPACCPAAFGLALDAPHGAGRSVGAVLTD